jgi:hypothetical protein
LKPFTSYEIYQNNIYAVILAEIIFSLSGYKKQDSEKIHKDAIAKALVNDINSDSLEADVVWLQNFGTRFSLADKN